MVQRPAGLKMNAAASYAGRIDDVDVDVTGLEGKAGEAGAIEAKVARCRTDRKKGLAV